MKNYYEILEVNKKASKEVIEKAYKVLIKKYHPDLYEGEEQQYAEKKTKEINEAYRVLSNVFLKEQYDTALEEQEMYEKQPKQNNNVARNSNRTQVEKTKQAQEIKKKKTGTLDSIIELTKDLFQLMKNKEKRQEIKEVTRKDIIALALTIVVIIIIGIILWFIPFTNGWMRQLLFENPLFSWIGKLFS